MKSNPKLNPNIKLNEVLIDGIAIIIQNSMEKVASDICKITTHDEAMIEAWSNLQTEYLHAKNSKRNKILDAFIAKHNLNKGKFVSDFHAYLMFYIQWENLNLLADVPLRKLPEVI